jgi:uncharacterized membrane protein YtjA (UPF0391 family)
MGADWRDGASRPPWRYGSGVRAPAQGEGLLDARVRALEAQGEGRLGARVRALERAHIAQIVFDTCVAIVLVVLVLAQWWPR